jgi:hypothetical protein
MPLDLTRDVAIRWEQPDATAVALLRQAGVTPVSEAEVRAMSLPEHGGGLWPGIARPPSVDGRGDETASASREPWVDSNGYKVGWLRALHPDRPAVLHYKPDLGDRAVPYDTLELALLEAWLAGGNYILAVEPHYRTALLRGDEKARAAWAQLGRTVAWLREHIALFRQATVPIVMQVVDDGEESAEIANLMYRRNVSPLLCAEPQSHPQCLVLVAANLRKPSQAAVRTMLAQASAGVALVVAADPKDRWWRAPGLRTIRTDEDREIFALGQGRLIAYRSAIADPSEFAMDVVDVLTHRRRPVRMWNASSVIGLVTASPEKGERLLHLVNYGSPIDIDTQVRVQGHYTKATMIRPDGAPVTLATARRGSTTEVQVPELRRAAAIRFR